MAQRKISAYWLILIGVILVVTLALTVGMTYARYVNTAQWNTLVNTQAADEPALILDGSQIIDLGQLPLGETQVPFSLNAEPAEAVTLGQTQGITSQLQNVEGVYTLMLSVESYPETAATMQIPVLAGEQTLGTFRITLPAAEVTQTPENSDDTTGTGEEDPQEGAGNTDETLTDGADVQTLDAEGSTATEEVVEYLQVTPLLLTEEYLRISLGVSYQADLVEITLNDGFPAGTRYSVDGGATWYLLYFGGTIRPEVQTELSILVDVSGAARIPVGSCVLKAESYTGQTRIKTLSGDVVYEAVALTSPELLTAAEDALTVSLPQSLGENEFNCYIEILTTDAEGNLIYSDATASFEIVNDATNIMTVRLTQQLPQAGTYRLNLTWSSGETLVHQSLIPFFISYSDANTGGAE